MKLEDPMEPSRDEMQIQELMEQYPELRSHITFLTNSLRESLITAMLEMEDPADMQKSLRKDENMMKRLGIQVFRVPSDWKYFLEEYLA